MFNIKGTIKVIKDTEKISEKFQKREFVLETKSGQYDQTVLFQLTQDGVSLIDQYKVGDEVTAHFDLRGREWTSPKDGTVRYFNTLSVWKLEGAAQAAPADLPPPPAANDAPIVDETDDLPF